MGKYHTVRIHDRLESMSDGDHGGVSAEFCANRTLDDFVRFVI